jgi:hypothetical protein
MVRIANIKQNEVRGISPPQITLMAFALLVGADRIAAKVSASRQNLSSSCPAQLPLAYP